MAGWQWQTAAWNSSDGLLKSGPSAPGVAVLAAACGVERLLLPAALPACLQLQPGVFVLLIYKQKGAPGGDASVLVVTQGCARRQLR